MNETTKDLHTYCIGRHLIDLPEEFSLTPGNASLRIEKTNKEQSSAIETTQVAVDVSIENFQNSIKKRHAEIALRQHVYLKKSMLNYEKKLSDRAMLFRAYESNDSSKDDFRSELHVLVENVYVVLKVVSYEDKFSEAEDWLLALSQRIELMTPQTQHSAGFCFGSLIVKGKLAQEYTEFDFSNKRYPDLSLSGSINSYAQNSENTLLQRTSGPKSLLTIFNVGPTVLRKGELKVAGMRAQEWLGWAMLEEGKNRHQEHTFNLETMRAVPSLEQPLIHLEMLTGQADASGDLKTKPPSDSEAIAMWDAIIKSIRLRPGSI